MEKFKDWAISRQLDHLGLAPQRLSQRPLVSGNRSRAYYEVGENPLNRSAEQLQLFRKDTTKGYKKDKVYIGPRLRILGNHDFLRDMNEKTKEFVHHNTNAILKKGHENIYYVTYNFSTAKNF